MPLRDNGIGRGVEILRVRAWRDGIDDEHEEFFRLIPHGNEIDLSMVDARGKPIIGGKILTLSSKGITRCPNAATKLPINTYGEVKIVKII